MDRLMDRLMITAKYPDLLDAQLPAARPTSPVGRCPACPRPQDDTTHGPRRARTIVETDVHPRATLQP
jgi:hypothetical protein